MTPQQLVEAAKKATIEITVLSKVPTGDNRWGFALNNVIDADLFIEELEKLV